MFKLDLEKAEEQEIKLPARKISTFALLTRPKLLTVWITVNCRKFLKRWGCPTTLLSPGNLYVGQEATVRTGHRTTD